MESQTSMHPEEKLEQSLRKTAWAVLGSGVICMALGAFTLLANFFVVGLMAFSFSGGLFVARSAVAQAFD